MGMLRIPASLSRSMETKTNGRQSSIYGKCIIDVGQHIANLLPQLIREFFEWFHNHDLYLTGWLKTKRLGEKQTVEYKRDRELQILHIEFIVKLSIVKRTPGIKIFEFYTWYFWGKPHLRCEVFSKKFSLFGNQIVTVRRLRFFFAFSILSINLGHISGQESFFD